MTTAALHERDSGVRYAVYFAPRPTDPLWTFGSSVLGRDASTGRHLDYPTPLLDRMPDWPAIVAGAAQYGFHATLKAPFHLAAGVDEPRLLDAVDRLARRLHAVDLGRLEVAAMTRFVALLPGTPPRALHDLAAAVVRDLDDLRAPLSDADRQRRQPQSLTVRQRRQLDRWGYPFVLEDFRFHMTLSGPLAGSGLTTARDSLRQLYATVAAPVSLDQLCIFRQPSRTAAFQIISRHVLAH